ncbi:MAG: hypothetical protein VKJ46_15930 [Leptolyngbyaceae bacterium]|nr:hypothetical protein [Leptolyngbyaceae bacterium]
MTYSNRHSKKVRHFTHEIRNIIASRPKDGSILLLHCEEQDLDSMLSAIYGLREVFHQHGLIPVISSKPCGEVHLAQVSLALLSACYLLSKKTGKSAEQTGHDVVEFSKNLPTETVRTWMREMNIQGLN